MCWQHFVGSLTAFLLELKSYIHIIGSAQKQYTVRVNPRDSGIFPPHICLVAVSSPAREMFLLLLLGALKFQRAMQA